MPRIKPSLDNLGQLVVGKRGEQGIRAAAKEIGISPATLSRVEHGHLPDLQKFRLICRWLDVDPNQLLGFASEPQGESPRVQLGVHFKKSATTQPETAEALAQMILYAQRALRAQDEL